MAMPISSLVYLPNFNIWARPIMVTPLKSQSSSVTYEARGIWHKNSLDVMTQDGQIFSDHKITLSIRDDEFAVTPLQGDQIEIPATDGHPSLGAFEVMDADYDGEGGTELVLRSIRTATP